MVEKERYLVVLALGLALCNLIVPYCFLRESGSFLFWILTTLFMIVAGTAYTRNWGRKKEKIS